MADEEKHAAIISIDFKLLLKMLDFEGGTIHRVYMDDEIWQPGTFNIVLEHLDLDRVKPDVMLRKVNPTYLSYYGEDDSLLKKERTDPPKKEKT